MWGCPLCPLLVWAPDVVPEGWLWAAGTCPCSSCVVGESGLEQVAGSHYPTVVCVHSPCSHFDTDASLSAGTVVVDFWGQRFWQWVLSFCGYQKFPPLPSSPCRSLRLLCCIPALCFGIPCANGWEAQTRG